MSRVMSMNDAIQTLLRNECEVQHEMDLPPGMYMPDSIERREESKSPLPRPPSLTRRKREVDQRFRKFLLLLQTASFDDAFLTNLELKAGEILESIWLKISQMSPADNARLFLLQTVSCGALMLYACKKTAEAFVESGEFRKPSQMLLKQLLESEQNGSLAFSEIEAKLQLDCPMAPLSKWLPRNASFGGGSVGSSSGHSSPTSSIGMSSVSGIGMTLTPRILSKNPLIKSLLPWNVIKAFAQSEGVSQIFEECVAQSEDAGHTGKDLYIYADCTVIALVRALLQNEKYMLYAARPSSPVKRRRDGSEEKHVPQTDDDVHDDRASLSKAFADYIHFIHEHASDLHTDDTVSAAAVIERHLRHLVPCAIDYLRECEFEGFT